MAPGHRGRKLVVLAASVLGALLAVELVLRVWSPVPLDAGGARADRTDAPGHVAHELDEDLGFKPVLGGPDYAEHGAMRNEYALEKRAGVRRLLFVGDSVTRRGKIIDGLRAELGEGFEYWNAGVEGYSTRQELEYYRRHLAGVAADHVVLTFHLNDFSITPVILVRERIGVGIPLVWLWRVSYLYRLLWRLRVPRPPKGEEESREAIFTTLAEFRDLASARGARFTVLVMPWLRPRAKWPGSLSGKHAAVLEALERDGIQHYAFLDELDAALEEGEAIQEKPLDPQHPSAAFARRMARSMIARGFQP